MNVNTKVLIDRLKRNIFIGTSHVRGTQMLRIASADRQEARWWLTLKVSNPTSTPRIVVKDQEVIINEVGECSILDEASNVFLILRIRKDDSSVADFQWLEEVFKE